MEEFNSLETNKFGTFGENMLNASDLVRTNRMTHLRSTGKATGSGAEDWFIYLYLYPSLHLYLICCVEYL